LAAAGRWQGGARPASYADGVQEQPARRPTPALPRAAALYSSGRIALFVLLALLVNLATGLNGLPLLLAAVLGSGVLGLFLLSRQRDDLSAALVARREGRVARDADLRRRLAEDESA